MHLQADPTKLELLAREFKDKKEKFKDNQKQSILERYGGEEHLDAPPKQLLMAQTVSDLDVATSLLTSHPSVTTIFRLTSEKYLKKIYAFEISSFSIALIVVPSVLAESKDITTQETFRRCTNVFTLLFLQEDYVEYSRTGSVIKGAERAKVKSMYEEDVYINNHSVGGTVF